MATKTKAQLESELNALSAEVDALRPIAAAHNQFLTKSPTGRFLFNRLQNSGKLFQE